MGIGLLKFSDNYETIECNHKIFFTDAINVKKLKERSVNLIVTSPPYGTLKNYENRLQLGYNDSYAEYLKKLCEIFTECIRVLAPQGNICINIGNQFIRSSDSPKNSFEIIPIYEYIVNFLYEKFNKDLSYIGTINWKKVTTSNTSGGGKVMGSYLYPASGIFFTNREFIIIFRKQGKRDVDENMKKLSRISREEWKLYFDDTWNFPGERQDIHGAVFPEELPKRLIKMFSFVGDTVLDPFIGTGTTSLACSKLARNSIGYEIGFGKDNEIDFKKIIKDKIELHETIFKYIIEIDKKEEEKDMIIKNKYSYL